MDAQRPIVAREAVPREIARRARRQLGLVTREQLLSLGVPGRSILRWVAAGRLMEILPRVYSVPEVRPTWEQRALAALLWSSDGVLCGLSAARVWRLDVDPKPAVELLVTRRMRSLHPWLLVRQCTNGSEVASRKVDGLRVTQIERTLLDLARELPMGSLEEALESALRRKLTTVPKLRDFTERSCVRGIRGCRQLRRLLDIRGDQAPTGSRFETRLNALLRRAGLRQPVRQHETFDGARFIARVDLAFPESKVAIEADSWKHHSGREAWQSDSRKTVDLTALGWIVLRFTYDDLVTRAEWVIDRIRRALGGRLFD